MKRKLTGFIGGLPVLLLALHLGQPTDALQAEGSRINLLRAPNNGLQPQAVIDDRGILHLIYFAGGPSEGDIFYMRREAGKAEFSTPLRVNSQLGSAIATGTIRGAQITLGKRGRVHVAWNGSHKAAAGDALHSSPMLYARLNDAGTAFEPQRNLMQTSSGLDGGGSVAADRDGNVYVAWHGSGEQKGEEYRRVWLAVSTDDGKTFAREVGVSNQDNPREMTGACACCGMRAFVDRQGIVYLLYRTATQMTERGMFLLVSLDKGRTFHGQRIDEWTLTSCPMSSVTMTQARQTMAAWENNGQVFFASLAARPLQKPAPIAAPEATGKRKHPVVVANAQGETLLIWTEGTGWKKGGSLAWQLFGRNGQPTAERGTANGVPVWGLATAVSLPNGEFMIIY